MVALLAAALVLAACGGGSKQVVRRGEVRVFFCTTVSMPDCHADATHSEEMAVGSALRRRDHVVTLAYISKAEALRRFKKEDPLDLSVKLPANPLPDEWVVTVDSEGNEATVGKAICAAHYAGVQPCAAAGQLGQAGGVAWGSPIADRIRRLLR